jgi:hypothetical protein
VCVNVTGAERVHKGDVICAVEGGTATAMLGDDNTATVIGDGSTAFAEFLTGCTAEAIGDGVSDTCP